jgi:hypothetical protein
MNKFLPIDRWGGGPCEAWWRGRRRRNPTIERRILEGGASYPSTTLRVVPLPTGFAGREEQ